MKRSEAWSIAFELKNCNPHYSKFKIKSQESKKRDDWVRDIAKVD